MKKYLCVVFFSLFFVSCAHNVVVQPKVSPIAYQFDSNKLNGDIGVYIHPELSALNEEVKPSTYQCSAWSYPVEAGTFMEKSIFRSIEHCFTKAQPVDEISNVSNFDGILAVELVDFDVDLTFIPGFWSMTADAFAEMSVKMTFYDKNMMPIWHSFVGYSKKKSADAGGACKGGATAIGESMEHCMKKMSIQIAEKITSASDLKNYFFENKPIKYSSP